MDHCEQVAEAAAPRDDLDAFLDEDGIREEVTARAVANVERARVRYADQGYRITTPIQVHSRADIASLLRAHRIASGLTCEQFDALAGWSDRYVTKLENFKGTMTGGTRPSFTVEPPSPNHPDGQIAASFMAEVWLETAGLALVLLPAELAASIGAMPAPKRGGA